MSTIVWIPKKDIDSYNDYKIGTIYACAFPRKPISPGVPLNATGKPMTNHWGLFLCITPKMSIRIDPAPGSNFYMTLMSTKKDYHYSRHAVKVFKMAVSGLPVGGFFSLLGSSKYDKYKFNNAGLGCRYWIQSVIKLLQEQNHLKTDGVAALADIITKVWCLEGKLAPPSEQSGLDSGEFYELSK